MKNKKLLFGVLIIPLFISSFTFALGVEEPLTNTPFNDNQCDRRLEPGGIPLAYFRQSYFCAVPDKLFCRIRMDRYRLEEVNRPA